MAWNFWIFLCLTLAFQSAWADVPFESVKFQIFEKHPTDFETSTSESVKSVEEFFMSDAVESVSRGDGSITDFVPYLEQLNALFKVNERLLKPDGDCMNSIDERAKREVSHMHFYLMDSVMPSIRYKISRLDAQNQPNAAIRKANAKYIQTHLQTILNYFDQNDGIFIKHPLIAAPLLINLALIIAVFTPIANNLLPAETKHMQLACNAKVLLEDYRARSVFQRANRLNSRDLYYKEMAAVLTRPYNQAGYDDSHGILHCSLGCTDFGTNDKKFCLVDMFGQERYKIIQNDCISEYVGLLRHRTEKMFPVELLDKECINRAPRTLTGKV